MTATPLEGLRYLAADTPLYPAHHHAATLIELALDRGIKEDRLLRHTKLFRDDICKPTALLREPS
jgi:hypothetical protein